LPGLDRLIVLRLHMPPMFGRLARAPTKNVFFKITQSNIQDLGRARAAGSRFARDDKELGS